MKRYLTKISSIVLLALTIALIVASCKKEKTPYETCPDSGSANCENVQNIKNFFYFKVGSWWVYEEETSGERDSIYVTEASEDPNTYNFDVRMYSTYEDYYYHYWPVYALTSNCPDNGTICTQCLTVMRSKYKPGDFVAEEECFYFVPKVGFKAVNYNVHCTNNMLMIEQGFDSININQIQLLRTFVLKEDCTSSQGNQKTRFYYSENCGVSKKELLDSSQIWNLVNYYIQP